MTSCTTVWYRNVNAKLISKKTLGAVCIDLLMCSWCIVHTVMWNYFFVLLLICIPSFWNWKFLDTGDVIKRKQPLLRLGMARYIWCMSLFANQFPQSQSATGENRNHFPPSGVPWIYERRGAIYSSALTKGEMGPYKHIAFYVWWGRECKEFGLWIFIPGTLRE